MDLKSISNKYVNPYYFKNNNLDTYDLIKLALKYLKEDKEESLSIVNFNSWYGREISGYIIKKFKSWNSFKKEVIQVCLKRDRKRIVIHYRKDT